MHLGKRGLDATHHRARRAPAVVEQIDAPGERESVSGVSLGIVRQVDVHLPHVALVQLAATPAAQVGKRMKLGAAVPVQQEPLPHAIPELLQRLDDGMHFRVRPRQDDVQRLGDRVRRRTLLAPHEKATGIEGGTERGEHRLPMAQGRVVQLGTGLVPGVFRKPPAVVVVQHREPAVCLGEIPQVGDGAVEVVLHHVLVDAPSGILDVSLEIAGSTHRLAGWVDDASRLEERHVELGIADDPADSERGLQLPGRFDPLEAL